MLPQRLFPDTEGQASFEATTGKEPAGNPSFELQRGELPDAHALIGREIVRVPWLYSEGRIPGVHIAGWADYPERARGVGVRDDLLSYVVFPRLAPPGLRPTEKHALIAAEAIDHRSRSVQRAVIGLKRYVDSAQVGDILSHGQIPIDVCTRDGLIAGILRPQNLCPGLKGVCVGFAPPVAELPSRVKLTSLIVEAVRQFVPDDGADCTVVDRWVRCGIEQRRLKYAGGKDDVA